MRSSRSQPLASAGFWIGRPCLLLLGALLAVLPLHAARGQEPTAQPQRVISAVSPDVIEQGETIVLTITGENLPTGSVVVEFFPQHVALLDILLTNSTRVVAQVKVPNTAPAGSYNILIYNQLGEEAFAEDMLTVGARLITPVFHDFDPKVIAKASTAFAVVLSGEAVTQDIISHLRMDWTRADQPVTGLVSSFSYGGAGKVVCAVSGRLPSGVIQGQLFMDDKPVYLIEITLQTDQPLIAGSSPARFDVSAAPYVIRLLGAGFSESMLKELEVQLASSETTARPRSVELVDAVSIDAEFTGPLPAGDYALLITSAGSPAYTAQITLVAGEAAGEQAAADGVAESSPDAGIPADETAETAAQIEQPDIQPDVQPEEQPEEQTPATAEQPAEIAWSPRDSVLQVEPSTVPSGSLPCRFTVSAVNLSNEILRRLALSLSFGEESCELLFVGAAGEAITCLFAAPTAGWPFGIEGTLSISDPLAPAETFSSPISVSDASGMVTTPAGIVEHQPAATDSSQAQDAGLSVSAGGDPLRIGPLGFAVILLPAGKLPEPVAWQAVEASSELMLLDRTLGSFSPEAAQFTVDGKPVIRLSFRRDATKLQDLAYEVLVAELTSTEQVPLKLVWPELGLELSLSAVFRETSADDPQGVLEQLGLDGE